MLGTTALQPRPVQPASAAVQGAFFALCVFGLGAFWWTTRSTAPVRNRGARRVSRNPKLVGNAKFSELGTLDAVARVRASGSREQLGFMAPGLVKKLRALPPGIYKYGHGPKKGEVITRYTSAKSLKSALTSARIGARAVSEYHWVIDNFDPSYPVVIRIIDDKGKSAYRVEEYAQKIPSEKVAVSRKRSTRR